MSDDPTDGPAVTLDALLQCFPGGSILIFDRDLRFTMADDRAFAGVLPEASMAGRTIFEVFPPPTAALVEPSYRLALAGVGSTTDMPFGGHVFEVRLGPVWDGVAVVAGVGHVEDVTSRRRREGERLALSDSLAEANLALGRAASTAGANEARYRALVDHLPDTGVSVWDRHHRIVVAQGAAVAARGFDAARLFGATPEEALNPTDAAVVHGLLDAAFEGRAVSEEVRFETSGRENMIDVVPLPGGRDGRSDEVMLVARDIGRSKERERDLTNAEARWRAAFDFAPVGVLEMDLTGIVLRSNRALGEILGRGDEPLGGRSFFEFLDPSERREAHRNAATVGIGALTSAERSLFTPAGERRWVAIRATRLDGTESVPDRLLVHVLDVSVQRRTEEILEVERRRLRDVQTIGRVGSWERDLTTGRMTWSDMLFELYGVDRGADLGVYADALERLHPDDRAPMATAMTVCAEHGTLMRLRYRFTRRNDGELRWFDMNGQPIYDGDRCVRIVGAVVDVTDQVRAEHELEKARDAAVEASRQKSAFLATMSHEIRTPMNAVIGMTGLLLDTPLDADQREFVDTVRASGDALLAIINDILDFSKIEAGGLQLEQRPFDLRLCVEDALELVAATSNAKELELIGHVGERCPAMVVGDVTRLRQIFVNLLGNAVKFTANGQVVLTVVPDDASGGDVGVTIAVADTGIGIPPERLTSMFEAFSQVDSSTTRLYGGTGLGLAISQRLVEAMGGVLGVDSVPGAGSTFHFSVILGRCAQPPASVPLRTQVELGGRSVLVVDDNPTNRHALRLQLESWGMVVTEASNGKAALGLVDAADRFDIAVVDMQMPGMTGAELAATLRSSSAGVHMPLILLSSRTDRPLPERDDLFSSILTKPVRSARLRQHLCDALSPPASSHPIVEASVGGISMERKTLRVLLAEDNAINQRLGRLMLTKLGHHIDVVGNGREATEAVRAIAYDVVLMDIEMPEMDGLSATRLIRSNMPADRQPHIVAMTASALVEDRQACNEAGMDDYLAKPVRLQDLDIALQRATGPDTRFPSMSP